MILYSWRFAPGSSPSIFAFTGGEGGQQRMNVALTRARHQAVHFISAPIEKFPVASSVTAYLKHCLEPENLLGELEQHAHRDPASQARKRVGAALSEAGFETTEDFVACGVCLDLLVADPASGRRAAVFVDAEIDPSRPADALERIDAHSVLERAGWTVLRVPATESLPDPQRAVERVKERFGDSTSKVAAAPDESVFDTVRVSEQPEPAEYIEVGEVLAQEIDREDRSDYFWEIGPVEARLHAGDEVFQSDFERELYDCLALIEGLHLVSQWPSRDKFIDLVVTDTNGRRLAVEADGEQHHTDLAGQLIPEDVERQDFLKQAGWVFHRIRHRDFTQDPGGEINRLLNSLRAQPANDYLAARLRGQTGASEREQLNLQTGQEPATSYREPRPAGDSPTRNQPPPQSQNTSDSASAARERTPAQPPEGRQRTQRPPRREPLAETEASEDRNVDRLLSSPTSRSTQPETTDPAGQDGNDLLVSRQGLQDEIRSDERDRVRQAPTQPLPPASSTATPRETRPATEGRFSDLPLGLLSVQIATLVGEQEPIRNNDIPKLYEERYSVQVPRRVW
ncbi:MAG: DUF559 domain-containing protein [Actinomycetia bacterium]|nr:DUF559 domain-containing protein [Actinomycetes bacterium]